MKLNKWLLLTSLLGVMTLGCERTDVSSPSRPESSSSRKAASAESSAWQLPEARRLVAIGDVHGDFAAARAALRLAGAIDENDHWAGGDLTVVQTGDQLDRGDDERQILEWFSRLSREAEQAGGRFIAMNGNHEVMNVQGDFRYVTGGGFEGWENLSERSPDANQVSGIQRERAAAFLPGGQFARLLATRNVVLMVGDTVFAHGGVLPKHLDAGIENINLELSAWMRGDQSLPDIALANDSPFWSRHYSNATVTPDACAMLGEVLSRLNAKRMVVGHTVQKSGITSACNERVFHIDVGLAAYYGGGPVQVLLFEDGEPQVLSSDTIAPVKNEKAQAAISVN
jgi:hypothetical protein